jgi:hypothetical protein
MLIICLHSILLVVDLKPQSESLMSDRVVYPWCFDCLHERRNSAHLDASVANRSSGEANADRLCYMLNGWRTECKIAYQNCAG